MIARLKNFLMGWLLVLGLKECPVECETLCVRSEVILESIVNLQFRMYLPGQMFNQFIFGSNKVVETD